MENSGNDEVFSDQMQVLFSLVVIGYEWTGSVHMKEENKNYELSTRDHFPLEDNLEGRIIFGKKEVYIITINNSSLTREIHQNLTWFMLHRLSRLSGIFRYGCIWCEADEFFQLNDHKT